MIIIRVQPIFRCVEKRDKAVSLGLTAALISLFAVFPSKILFGYIFDQTCLLWSSGGKESGNCWIYDTVFMRWGSQVGVILGSKDL